MCVCYSGIRCNTSGKSRYILTNITTSEGAEKANPNALRRKTQRTGSSNTPGKPATSSRVHQHLREAQRAEPQTFNMKAHYEDYIWSQESKMTPIVRVNRQSERV